MTDPMAPIEISDNCVHDSLNETKDRTQDRILDLSPKRSVPVVGYSDVGSSPTASTFGSYDEH